MLHASAALATVLACLLLASPSCASAAAPASTPATAAAPMPTPLALSCTGCHVSSLTQVEPEPAPASELKSEPDPAPDPAPGPEPPAVAAMAGLERLTPAQIALTLRAYASGARAGTVMPRLAPALDDDDIAALAAYFGRPSTADRAMEPGR